MSSFAVAGSVAGSVAFIAVQEGYSSKSGALEEKRVNIVVDNAADWGALFSLVTPREFVVVRSCRGQPGNPMLLTTKVDIGGGAGTGALTLDNVGTWTALLVDLSDDAPEVGALTRRLVSSAWLIVA